MKEHLSISKISSYILSAIVFWSCTENNNIINTETQDEPIYFSFEIAAGENSGYLRKNTSELVNTKSIIVSISNNANPLVHHEFSLAVNSLNGKIISEPLVLKPGTYKLFEYKALDLLGNVIYASPKKESDLAQLVNNPLDIEFTVTQNNITLITPQVIEVKDHRPEDFGYGTFHGVIPSFLLKIITYVHRIEQQDLQPINTNIQVTIRDTTNTLQTFDYTIPKGIEIIRLPDVQDSNYTFTVSTENLNTVTEIYSYSEITGGTDSVYLLEITVDSTIYHHWNYSGNIHFNTTETGAHITEDLYHFPTLIRLTDAQLFIESQNNGEDIRFSKTDNTPIPYEIEWWDPSNNTAGVWIQMDTILGNSNTQSISIHWGNSSAVSESDGETIFHESTYSAVWHMNEDPSGSFLTIRDRTSHGHHLTPHGDMTFNNSVQGMIGQSIEFDGMDDFLDLGGLSTSFSNGMSICTWIQYDSFNAWSRILDCGNGPGFNNILFANMATSNTLAFEVHNDSVERLHTPGTLSLNTWDHMCVTIDTLGETTHYQNGVPLQTATISLPENKVRHNCYVGKSNWDFDGYLNAKLDEMRISRIGHSSNWIKLSFESQKEGTSWIQFTR